MNSVVFTAGLMAASVATAASVLVIQPSSLPSAAPTVQFEGLPAADNVSSITSYAEQGLTLTASAIRSTTFFTSANNKAADLGFQSQSSILFSFNTTVDQISFKEFIGFAKSVTLYSDAAGTQSLGTFNTPHTFGTNIYTGTFAFQSDTPFRSFGVTVRSGVSDTQTTFYVDDLRYNAVPEPVAFAAVGIITTAICLRRRRA